VQLLGVIPESKAILTATNLGQPVLTMDKEDAAQGPSSSSSHSHDLFAACRGVLVFIITTLLLHVCARGTC
jgi:hypothetical protein